MGKNAPKTECECQGKGYLEWRQGFFHGRKACPCNPGYCHLCKDKKKDTCIHCNAELRAKAIQTARERDPIYRLQQKVEALAARIEKLEESQ